MKDSFMALGRACLSGGLIYGAAHLARDGAPATVIDDHLQDRGMAMAIVMEAVGFVEATINEFYSDCSTNAQTNPNKQLDHAVRVQLAADVQGGILTHQSGAYLRMQGFAGPESIILRKYQRVLAAAGKPLFSAKDLEYDDLRVLIDVRNAIVHSEPETVDLMAPPSSSWDVLLSKRVPRNPKFAVGYTMPENIYLYPAGMKWAIKAAWSFVEAFHVRLGVTMQLGHLRPHVADFL